MSGIASIIVPKWGLAMDEGTIVEWHMSVGDEVSVGDDLVDIETTKITNVCEAYVAGTLRRIVAKVDETLPVGGLIGVIADSSVSEADIDKFVSDFVVTAEVPEDGETPEASMGIVSLEIDGVGPLRVGKSGETQSGVPIVLIHGFGGELENWSFVMEGLAAKHPVYAIEMPGHGQSTKNVGGGMLGDLTGSVIVAIERLELDEFILGGHSLGAAVSCAVSEKLGSSRVKGLTLVAPAAMPGAAVSDTYINGFINAKRQRDFKPIVSMLFDNPDMVTRDMLEGLIRFKRLDGANNAMELIGQGLLGGDPAYGKVGGMIENYDGGILMLASNTDQVVGVADETQLPGHVNYVWIDNAGHMPHVEAFDVVTKEMLKFADSI